MTATLRFHGDTVATPGTLDFAVNVWPGARPQGLEAALARALADTRYPDQRAAREALARKHGRSPDQILLGNGACDLFWLLAGVLRPARAACIHPSFTEPEAAFRSVGTRIVRVQRDPRDWRLDPAAVPEEADVVVLGNPNNPTGTLDPAQTIVELARDGRRVVVDESFIDFVAGARESLAGRSDVPGLVVVRSLTKLWSLAGVRAGYLLADAELVARLEEHRQAWPVSGIACAALEWCAGDAETPRVVAAEVAVERRRLTAGLAELGLTAAPSEANFLLFRGPTGLVGALRERGVAVRPAESFPGLDRDHVRVAVRGLDDNDRLLAAMREVLAA